MIESFRHKGLRRLYEEGDHGGVQHDLLVKLQLILATMDVATSLDALRRPDFRLHALKGDLQGVWAVKVNANWRVIFRFEEGCIKDVDLVDYH